MSLASLLADPLQGRPIGERMRRVLALAFAGCWVLGVAVLATRPAFYPTWFAVGANAVLVAAIAVTLATWRSSRAALWAAQAVVVLAAVVRVVEAVVLRTPNGIVDYPPLTYVLTMALGATGVVFRPGAGLPLVLVNLGGLLAERLALVGVVQSIAEAAYIAPAGLTGFLVVRAVRVELQQVERAAATTERRRDAALLARERAELRGRWDSLVHDTVLACLTLASRGQRDEAADVAREALRELRGVQAPVGDPAAAILAHAARLGLDLRLDASEWPQGRPGDALVVAASEALTNVARHSGQRSAVVTTRSTDGVVQVVVSDQGRGFDPERVPEERLGIRHAIDASMRAVGGRADVRSSPGNGTLVVLRTAAHDPGTGDVEPGPPWSLASLAWLAVVFAVQIGSGIAIGTLFLPEQALPWVSVAGMVLLPLVTALLAFVPTGRPWWPATLALMALLWAALLGDVRDLTVLDWRTWFIGSFDAAVALIALRDRYRTALMVTLAGTCVGSTVLLWRGVFAVWPIIEGTYQTVIWGMLAGVYRRFMDRAAAQVTAEAAAQARAGREEQLAAARDKEVSQRRRSLDAFIYFYNNFKNLYDSPNPLFICVCGCYLLPFLLQVLPFLQ